MYEAEYQGVLNLDCVHAECCVSVVGEVTVKRSGAELEPERLTTEVKV